MAKKRKVVVPKESMDWLVKQLKSLYLLHKRMSVSAKTGFTHKGTVKLPANLDSRTVWEHAVVFFLEHKLNISRCLRVRFSIAGSKDSVPPNTLALDKYLKTYCEACEDMGVEMEMDFRSQSQICREYILTTGDDYGYKGKELYRFVLLNETLELSPLFRYCLAVDEGLDDVARRYQKRALYQYLTAPREYRRIWKEWLPERLRRKARRIAGGWNYA